MSILLEEMSEINKRKEKAKSSKSSSILNKNGAKESENYLGGNGQETASSCSCIKILDFSIDFCGLEELHSCQNVKIASEHIPEKSSIQKIRGYPYSIYNQVSLTLHLPCPPFPATKFLSLSLSLPHSSSFYLIKKLLSVLYALKTISLI